MFLTGTSVSHGMLNESDRKPPLAYYKTELYTHSWKELEQQDSGIKVQVLKKISLCSSVLLACLCSYSFPATGDNFIHRAKYRLLPADTKLKPPSLCLQIENP